MFEFLSCSQNFSNVYLNLRLENETLGSLKNSGKKKLLEIVSSIEESTFNLNLFSDNYSEKTLYENHEKSLIVRACWEDSH